MGSRVVKRAYRYRCYPTNEQTVGMDAGITSLVTLSTGEKIANPRHERCDRKRLALAQRRLARTQKGPANRPRPVRR
ncbi:hypothetical protein PA7_17050 [Pseudonocardia asaccharolytica DSM 44247 = NBRC 16224]|uniref:Probable transposase IS891/IS1136/IS1341 domain-containing protein n=1 Tax=Pseudonocardia asaccharolytica DSM 44247 = NBRC 16224 TaxID=1123024 RepID=A0A511D4L8_9PSEU|nr:hypothetical protein PA7_17050 [Pseudonocardia asaccharolytica DSM 44247 = NBRC 16224]